MADGAENISSACPIIGWRSAEGLPSLPEVYRTIRVPPGASFLRKMLAFAGPGYLVAVGY